MYTVRPIRWLLTAALATLLSTSYAFSADVAKIGLIDSQKVLMDSAAGKDVQTEINTAGKEMDAKLKAQAAELQALEEKLEREAMVMSKELRDEKEREMRIKVNDFKAQQKKYRQEIQTLEKNHLNRIRKEVLEIAKEIGKKGNYLLIMENGGVLYSPATIDITDELIKAYDAKYKKQTKKE